MNKIGPKKKLYNLIFECKKLCYSGKTSNDAFLFETGQKSLSKDIFTFNEAQTLQTHMRKTQQHTEYTICEEEKK